MAENALDLAATAYIDLASPAGLDNIASPFSVMMLLRQDVASGSDKPLATKHSAGGGWDMQLDTTNFGFSRELSVSNVRYRATTSFPTSTTNWYWAAAAYDQSLGATLKVGLYLKIFTDGSLTSLGINAIDEGSGTVVTDAANTLRLNYEPNYFAAGQDMDIAAFGIVSGKKTAGELDAIIANIQGTTWLGLWGKPTVTTGFPLLAGTGSGVAAGTTGGTVALATDAPDWYTAGGGGGALSAALVGSQGRAAGLRAGMAR